MLISLNWLKKYTPVGIPPEELAGKLTMVGLEVESIERLGEKYDKFVIGEVLEVAKHPNADKLSVCKVNTGTEELQIVCGAPNVAAGQKVIVGLSGAIVPHNQHDTNGKPFQLSQVKIRGVESFGMICSANELGLGEDKSGIMVLDGSAKVGTPLADHLNQNDIVFSIGITPNRPDAMSHMGIAREVSAVLNTKTILPKVIMHEGTKDIRDHVSVDVQDPVNCPRMTVRAVFEVKVKESPAWLQNSLAAVGVRPVNNVVDITNYVMLETGQPVHAYDYDKLAGHALVVKCAAAGEKFTTLDHKERILRADTLMICDEATPVGIAGIMGGVDSEISAATKNILIECAYFNPQSIRRSSRHFGLSTDVSQRFERGIDPNMTEWAATRVAGLVQQLCSGDLLKGIIDFYPQKISPKKISLRLDRLNKLLGTAHDAHKVSSCLDEIQIRQVGSPSELNGKITIEYEVPTFRPDIDREIDLIEEAARLIGYETIEPKAKATIRFADHPEVPDIRESLRSWLVGRGYYEVISNSMTERETARLTSDHPVEVANPISKEMASLRTGLGMSFLKIVQNNINHGVKNLRLFEIGKAYFRDQNVSNPRFVKGFREEERLGIVISGNSYNPSWGGESSRACDIFDLKGEIEGVVHKSLLDKIKFIPYTNTDALTESGLSIEISGENRGYLGKVRSSILKKFDIEQDIFLAEINIDGLNDAAGRDKKYIPLPLYPAVYRDLALIVDENLPAEQLLYEIKDAGANVLVNVDLFDIYRGDQIAAGKKSLAIALEFQSNEKTLAQNEIDERIGNIVRAVSRKFGAELRA